MKKRCKKCGEEKPIECFEKSHSHKDGRINKCHKCKYAQRKASPSFEKRKQMNTQAIRRWREMNPEYNSIHSRNNRDKYNNLLRLWKEKNKEYYVAMVLAYKVVNDFIKANDISRLPCQICGNPKIETHHHDYEKPLLVNFLCRKCHKRVQNNIIPAPVQINLGDLTNKERIVN